MLTENNNDWKSGLTKGQTDSLLPEQKTTMGGTLRLTQDQMDRLYAATAETDASTMFFFVNLPNEILEAKIEEIIPLVKSQDAEALFNYCREITKEAVEFLQSQNHPCIHSILKVRNKNNESVMLNVMEQFPDGENICLEMLESVPDICRLDIICAKDDKGNSPICCYKASHKLSFFEMLPEADRPAAMMIQDRCGVPTLAKVENGDMMAAVKLLPPEALGTVFMTPYRQATEKETKKVLDNCLSIELHREIKGMIEAHHESQKILITRSKLMREADINYGLSGVCGNRVY